MENNIPFQLQTSITDYKKCKQIQTKVHEMLLLPTIHDASNELKKLDRIWNGRGGVTQVAFKVPEPPFLFHVSFIDPAHRHIGSLNQRIEDSYSSQALSRSRHKNQGRRNINEVQGDRIISSMWTRMRAQSTTKVARKSAFIGGLEWLRAGGGREDVVCSCAGKK